MMKYRGCEFNTLLFCLVSTINRNVFRHILQECTVTEISTKLQRDSNKQLSRGAHLFLWVLKKIFVHFALGLPLELDIGLFVFQITSLLDGISRTKYF